jgi:hypothetical protein
VEIKIPAMLGQGKAGITKARELTSRCVDTLDDTATGLHNGARGVLDIQFPRDSVRLLLRLIVGTGFE